jgi:sigma-E factor negative regulatory protein RseB
MINKFVSFFTLLFITFSVQASQSQADVEKWLAKMHHAAHMINYEGNFVYGQNNDLTSMQIIHSVDKTGEYERLVSLDGSGREVIRSGDTVTCVLPDKKSVVVDKSRPDAEFPPMFPLKIEQLLKTYSFHSGEDAVVAGQPAKKLVIKPKDKYRYGHALWIDAKTGLLLKNHLLDENQNIVELFMFMQVKYPETIDKSRLISKNQTKKFTWYEAKDKKDNSNINKSMNWRVTKVPAGFVPGVQRHHEMTVSAMPVEHFMYSDGLSSVSVFVEKKMKSSKNLVGGSTMGAVHAYGREVGDYHVTVVGEVPHATVKMIADSVEQIKH